jgi:hypothetical protein
VTVAVPVHKSGASVLAVIHAHVVIGGQLFVQQAVQIDLDVDVDTVVVNEPELEESGDSVWTLRVGVADDCGESDGE